jgi:shikimate kinase
VSSVITGNIFLVGTMGCGKSTIGRLIAHKLDRSFYDSDHEIEVRTGVNIPWIFDIEGESGFRRREQHVIAELVQLSNIVLATGGGVVINAENRRLLAKHGYVIYLKTTVERQLERIASDSRRPLLQTPDPRQRLIELLEQRDPLYTEIADWVINAENLSIHTLLKKILTRCGNCILR